MCNAHKFAPGSKELKDPLRPAEIWRLTSTVSTLKQAFHGGTRTIVKTLEESIKVWNNYLINGRGAGAHRTLFPRAKHPSFFVEQRPPSVEGLDKAVKGYMDEAPKLISNQRLSPVIVTGRIKWMIPMLDLYPPPEGKCIEE